MKLRLSLPSIISLGLVTACALPVYSHHMDIVVDGDTFEVRAAVIEGNEGMKTRYIAAVNGSSISCDGTETHCAAQIRRKLADLERQKNSSSSSSSGGSSGGGGGGDTDAR